MHPRFIATVTGLSLLLICAGWFAMQNRQIPASDDTASAEQSTLPASDTERQIPTAARAHKTQPTPSPESDANLTTMVLTGNLTDEAGTPIAGARIAVHNAIVRVPDDSNKQFANTGTDGHYRVALRGTPKSLWRIMAEHDSYAPLPGAVTAETTTPIWNGKMKPVTTVSGRVCTHDGQPLASAKVWGVPSEFSSNLERMSRPCTDTVFTKTDGTFTLTRVPAHTPLTLMALPATTGWQFGATQVKSAPATDIEIVPEQGGCTISGTVIDEVGQPVADANVVLMNRAATTPVVTKTDTQGNFQCTGIPPGMTGLSGYGRNRFNEDRTEMQILTMQAGETTEGIVLRFLPPITELTAVARLVDAHTDAPINGCTVYVRWIDPTGKKQTRTCTTDGNGTLECPGIRAAEYTLRTVAPGLLPNANQDTASGTTRLQGTIANDYSIRRIVPPTLSTAGRDTFAVRMDQVPNMIFEFHAPQNGDVLQRTRMYLAEGAQGRHFEANADGNIHYSIPSTLADERTLMFIAVCKTGTAPRDCLLGSLEITVGEVRRAPQERYRIEMSTPEFWGKGKIDCADPSFLTDGSARVYPAFRTPKLGENGHLYINELTQGVDRSFEFPILPGYECGISFGYIAAHNSGIGQDYTLINAWLLPEQWAEREVLFIFDPTARTLTPIIK